MIKAGVLAKKLGMSFLYEGERRVPITLFSFEDVRVVGVSNISDGAEVLVGIGVQKNPTKPLQGVFKGHEKGVPKKVKKFSFSNDESFGVHQDLLPSLFEKDSRVDVSGVTKGCGFAGGMKRWNFGGLRASHGVSVSHRSIGSTGQCQDPGKVFKGKKMPGHMGVERRTVQNLRVVYVDDAQKILAIHGSVPGKPESYVEIKTSVKK